MKLLAWDTSSKSGAFCAMEWEPSSAPRLVSEQTLNVEATTHSERLLWGIHEILEASRWKLEDVDVFGVGMGPGSFTGLRIGITTARTLAHVTNKPLVGVSSLAALARPAAAWLAPTGKRSIVIAATDACKGELFALWGNAKSIGDCVAMADGDHPGIWKRGVEEKVLTPAELMKALTRKLKEGGSTAAPWLVVGEGRRRYLDAWSELPGSKEIAPPVPFLDQVQGRYIGLLAWEGFQAGLARPALSVHPRYLRASDAELKLKAGLLKKAPTGASA